MRISMKFYKYYDADFLYLKHYGVDLSELFREALAAYVKGESVHYYLPDCRFYTLAGKAKHTQFFFEITDPDSITFLEEKVQKYQRSAFLKTILRNALVLLPQSPYLKPNAVSHENEVIAKAPLDNLPNLKLLNLKDPKEKKYREAKRKVFSKEKPKKTVVPPTNPDDIFGDGFGKVPKEVYNSEKIKEEGQRHQEELKQKEMARIAQRKEPPMKEIQEDEDPFSDSGSDLFSQFEALKDQ